MKTLNEMNYTEQKELATLIQNWLDGYTPEVIKKAMSKIEDIINNETSMMMLRELKERREEERKDEADTIYLTLARMRDGDADADKYIDIIFNHPLTHADAYKSILYDMYIK